MVSRNEASTAERSLMPATPPLPFSARTNSPRRAGSIARSRAADRRLARQQGVQRIEVHVNIEADVLLDDPRHGLLERARRSERLQRDAVADADSEQRGQLAGEREPLARHRHCSELRVEKVRSDADCVSPVTLTTRACSPEPRRAGSMRHASAFTTPGQRATSPRAALGKGRANPTRSPGLRARVETDHASSASKLKSIAICSATASARPVTVSAARSGKRRDGAARS
jgi:hypothetical protein